MGNRGLSESANRPEQPVAPQHGDRSRVVEPVRGSEELTQAVIDSLAANIAVLDPEGEIIGTNAAWNRFARDNSEGPPQRTGIGVNYLGICRRATGDASDGARVVEDGIRAVLDGEAGEFQHEYPCHSPAEQRWFLLKATRLARGVGGAVLLHIDITERKLMEGKLLEAERLKVLTTGLIDGQEEERRRLARELHDGLNQQVAVVSIELGVLAGQSGEPLRSQIKDLQRRTIDLSDQVRRISHRLHPAALEHLGISAALRSLCQEFEAAHETAVHLTVPGDLGEVGRGQALCLYRIVQECLRNVARHSGASEARVILRRNGDSLELVVQDNGRGIDASGSYGRPGLGIASMKERVSLAGGSLVVTSDPGSGVRVEAQVPASESRK